MLGKLKRLWFRELKDMVQDGSECLYPFVDPCDLAIDSSDDLLCYPLAQREFPISVIAMRSISKGLASASCTSRMLLRYM